MSRHTSGARCDRIPFAVIKTEMREFVAKIPSSASEHTQLNGVDTNLLIQQMLQAVPEAERDSKSSVTISQEVRNGVNFGAKFQGQDCAYEPSRTPPSLDRPCMSRVYHQDESQTDLSRVLGYMRLYT